MIKKYQNVFLLLFLLTGIMMFSNLQVNAGGVISEPLEPYTGTFESAAQEGNFNGIKYLLKQNKSKDGKLKISQKQLDNVVIIASDNNHDEIMKYILDKFYYCGYGKQFDNKEYIYSKANSRIFEYMIRKDFEQCKDCSPTLVYFANNSDEDKVIEVLKTGVLSHYKAFEQILEKRKRWLFSSICKRKKPTSKLLSYIFYESEDIKSLYKNSKNPEDSICYDFSKCMFEHKPIDYYYTIDSLLEVGSKLGVASYLLKHGVRTLDIRAIAKAISHGANPYEGYEVSQSPISYYTFRTKEERSRYQNDILVLGEKLMKLKAGDDENKIYDFLKNHIN